MHTTVRYCQLLHRWVSRRVQRYCIACGPIRHRLLDLHDNQGDALSRCLVLVRSIDLCRPCHYCSRHRILRPDAARLSSEAARYGNEFRDTTLYFAAAFTYACGVAGRTSTIGGELTQPSWR